MKERTKVQPNISDKELECMERYTAKQIQKGLEEKIVAKLDLQKVHHRIKEDKENRVKKVGSGIVSFTGMSERLLNIVL